MPEPIRFYFDFASPYGYLASRGIEALGVRCGRAVEWRAIMVWSLLKSHGIAPPGESPVKWAYFVRDMKRSADYLGVPYRHPTNLPFSAHRAARLFHVVRREDAKRAVALAHTVYAALYVDERDIADPAVLIDVAGRHGLSPSDAEAAIEGPEGRSLLAAEMEEAAHLGVCGSPYFIVDGEPFFGADRLPQIDWRLSSQARAHPAPDRHTAGSG